MTLPVTGYDEDAIRDRNDSVTIDRFKNAGSHLGVLAVMDALRLAVLTLGSRHRLSAAALLMMVIGSSIVLSDPVLAQEQLSPQATALFAEANKQFDEGQWPVARDRFAQFIKDNPAAAQAQEARLSLSIILLEGQRVAGPGGMDRDYPAIIEHLTRCAGDDSFSRQAIARYYMGAALREFAGWHDAQAKLKPAEADKLEQERKQKLEAAQAALTQALSRLTEQQKNTAVPADGPLPEAVEWMARARCDLAWVEWRRGLALEAKNLTLPFLDDAVMKRSSVGDRGRFIHALALVALNDNLKAARSLAMLAPFASTDVGLSARFQLARLHHLSQERPEASALYEAVIANYDAQFLAARQVIADGNALKNQPRERARLEALVRGPVPEMVEQSHYQLASIALERSEHSAAADRFKQFIERFPKSSLTPVAQLRLGQCMLAMKQYAAAIPILQPLTRITELAGEALPALAQATAHHFDPNNAQKKQQAYEQAIALYRTAIEGISTGKDDASANRERANLLLALGDLQLNAALPKDAAATFDSLLKTNAQSTIEEQARQRQVLALHQAGEYDASIAAATIFLARYPRSPLLSQVQFHAASNRFAQAQLAAALPGSASTQAAWQPLYEQSIERYEALLKRDTGFAQAPMALMNIALAHHRMQRYEQATLALSRIAAANRTGPLSQASLLQADCLLRLAPADVSDALSAGKALQYITDAITHLEAFIPGNEQTSEGARAVLMLGECQQRMAAIMADPQEKSKALAAALNLFQQFPTRFGANHALVGEALLGRCNTMVLMGDIQGAITRLPRFQTQDPYPRSPIAPLALTRLASLLRIQGQHDQAVQLMAAVRAQHEAALLKDEARAAWVPMMQLEQALALRDAGKNAEALALFQSLAMSYPSSPQAHQALISRGLIERAQAQATIATAIATLKNPQATAQQTEAAQQALTQATPSLSATAIYFGNLAAAHATAGSAGHLQLLFEAAASHRALGDQQLQALLLTKERESHSKLLTSAKAASPANAPPPVVYPSSAVLTSLPMQPATKKAIDTYAKIVVAASDAPLALRARFEAATLLAQHSQFSEAIALLAEAIDLEPDQPLLDETHLTLGTCLLNKGDHDGAIEQFSAAIGSKTPSIFGRAYLHLAQVKLAKKDFDGAIKLLVPFRDKGEFQNIPGVTDRALLELGRAYAYASQWEPSRQAVEVLLNRFGSSELRYEARLMYADARLQQKNFDDAINHYREAAKATSLNQSDIAARALLRIGVCFNEKNQPAEALKILMPITVQFDHADHIAAALLEAARAQLLLKQPEEARKLLQRVTQEHPNSPWATTAQERLLQIK